MKREISQRWILSFADLSLLLLAFFVMLQAQIGDRLKVAAGIRNAFGGEAAGSGQYVEGFTAAAVFEPGEAILTSTALARFHAVGAQAARAGKQIAVTSQGRDGQSLRLDAWELAAARATAVARALREGGLAEAQIEISIPPMRGDEPAKGQRISLEQHVSVVNP